jgi:hypothetical protein
VETGIYIAKIDSIVISKKGTSQNGDWILFDLTLSVNSDGKRKVYKKIEPSWTLQQMYANCYSPEILDLKEWWQLKEKKVVVFIYDDP